MVRPLVLIQEGHPSGRSAYLARLCPEQGRTDPMGIRAMPWGPPPKGANQTFKNNAYQQKSVAEKLILHLITGETFLEEECGPPP